MALTRRRFLARTGLFLSAGAVASPSMLNGAGADSPPPPPPRPEALREDPGWEDVRRQFALSDDVIHMSAALIASHPAPVREAIDGHRRALDADPVVYLHDNSERLLNAARSAAGDYMGVDGEHIALTDSTTMGLGLVYTGLRLRPDEEFVSSEGDYYATHEAIRLSRARTGAKERRIALYDRIAEVTEEEIVARVRQAITPATRVLALTWVHSNTGLKLPVGAIAEALEEINAERPQDARVLFCVDGVHGFGNQNAGMADLGCDFFIAGCHKWLFGPRGTGIIVGREQAWPSLAPTIPSFNDAAAWRAWLTNSDPSGPTTAAAMTPGGYKPFEHRWAMTQAFAFHHDIGKARIEARTHELARQLKEGLAAMAHVTLYTPMSESLSAGIVCFDVDGMSALAAVDHLRARGIVASVTPYARRHARLTPSIRNTPREIETVLREIRAMAGR